MVNNDLQNRIELFGQMLMMLGQFAIGSWWMGGHGKLSIISRQVKAYNFVWTTSIILLLHRTDMHTLMQLIDRHGQKSMYSELCSPGCLCTKMQIRHSQQVTILCTIAHQLCTYIYTESNYAVAQIVGMDNLPDKFVTKLFVFYTDHQQPPNQGGHGHGN